MGMKLKLLIISGIWGFISRKQEHFIRQDTMLWSKPVKQCTCYIRNFNLPIDLQLQIFYHTILSILLYGSEVWGFEEIQIIEKLHCEFLRTITKLRKSTSLYMVYTELGRFPIEINVKSRMLNYWFSLKNTSSFKFSNLLYIFMKMIIMNING